MKRTRFLACLCSFLLAVALVPAPAFGQWTIADNNRVPIEELLAAGEYVEGEAIAVVRAGADVATAGQVEDLADASADSVELATAGALSSQGTVDDRVAQRVQSMKADRYTIKHVVDHGRTTEQILRTLYDDPDVVSAEPNYLIQNPTSLNDGDDSTQNGGSMLGAGSLQTLGPQSQAANSEDLTAEQWSLGYAPSAYGTTPRSPTNTYSMNVPGWNGGSENATTGTVCIMDTGIDTTHPDLQGVLFDFSNPSDFPAARYAELRAEYGMGQYGLNASGSSDKADVTGYDSHGTHVAGIVAAQWNGSGVSGIANGTKIFAVRIFGDDGESQDEASLLKGFEFLVNVAKDTNLKAVNCSWGGGIAQFSYEVMVNELGKKGVNVVYASGNRTTDLDETMDNGGMSSSPYSITVNAAQPDGKITDFSCYGQASTDVFAPGAQILSTISQEISLKNLDGSVAGRKIYKRFFPEATDSSNRLAYEQFADGSTGVRLFKENPALNGNPEEINASEFIDSNNGYGDKCSAAVTVTALHKAAEDPIIFNGSSGYVYAAIPINPISLDEVKYVSMDLAMSDSFKPTGGIASITCNVTGGEKPVAEIDTTASKAFHKENGAWKDGVGTGWVASALYNTYQCQWTLSSFNVDEFIAASNHAYDWLQQHPGELIPGERTEVGGYENYKNPGKVTSVYGWTPGDGKTYVIVKVALAAHGNEPSGSTKLYLDNMAVGTSSSYVASYEIMSGTSMAAPAVSGCLAVIAADEKSNADMTDNELEQAALERAAKLLASVDYDSDLSELCRTGGRVT